MASGNLNALRKNTSEGYILFRMIFLTIIKTIKKQRHKHKNPVLFVVANYHGCICVTVWNYRASPDPLDVYDHS